ncbi:MAG: glycosidase, partial [Proteobacteria bacterium]|nr:glycosidase [Pseudomonadota bacterium]
MNQLEHAIAEAFERDPTLSHLEQSAEGIRWLARENYQLRLADDADISQMVIFPQSENDNRGIEDLRMVRFVDDDGTIVYYGSYTAYHGYP